MPRKNTVVRAAMPAPPVRRAECGAPARLARAGREPRALEEKRALVLATLERQREAIRELAAGVAVTPKAATAARVTLVKVERAAEVAAPASAARPAERDPAALAAAERNSALATAEAQHRLPGWPDSLVVRRQAPATVALPEA